MGVWYDFRLPRHIAASRISQHQTILGNYSSFLHFFPEDTVKCAWLFLWGVLMGGCPDDMKPKNPRKRLTLVILFILALTSSYFDCP